MSVYFSLERTKPDRFYGIRPNSQNEMVKKNWLLVWHSKADEGKYEWSWEEDEKFESSLETTAEYSKPINSKRMLENKAERSWTVPTQQCKRHADFDVERVRITM